MDRNKLLDILDYLEYVIAEQEQDHCWTEYHENQIKDAREWLSQFYPKSEMS